MKLTQALAPIALAGTVAGGVLATPVAQATHVDVALLSGTAFFVGPTTLSTPSPTFAQTAADLFLQPLGFDGGDDLDTCVVGAAVCDAPLRILSTPALIQQDHSSFVGAAEIVRAVHAELAANPDAYDAENPLWIFGWSQGATAGSIAMAQLAHDGVDPQALHFVFIGNPVGADGISPGAGGDGPLPDFLGTSLLSGVQTPNDLFATTSYTIPGDPVADNTSTSPLGLLYEHMMYLGLTPEQVANHTATADGLITDIDISSDFDQFGAWLNAWSHGLVDSSWWEGIFYSVVASFYSAFGNIEDFFGDWLGIDWGGVEQTLDFWFPVDA
ncbi:PE-PPE domain-containing protein [Mycolicibacter hiberniae]|uniref:PE-PPE domain-containing protein n=1 Tax=Mycolicibacter hiberniae TaxID=29314 RepID=UPI000A149135|nr:PE-PPE domain-containing protein [Mycolicibacter hiberniae]MCV7088281.1 PE-PPE domain-containing protein [Mycolicibacter hiberniae]ORV68872.1 PE-PPE domain-containing protein [Mycolicibacter hiberniae]